MRCRFFSIFSPIHPIPSPPLQSRSIDLQIAKSINPPSRSSPFFLPHLLHALVRESNVVHRQSPVIILANWPFVLALWHLPHKNVNIR